MNKITLILGLVVALVVGGIGFLVYQSNQPGPLDGFAQCLSDKGAVFYGAFWCPHCQNQKKLFGNSARLLPYTECSTADGQGQLQVCKDKEITGYPTWVFADGSRKNGEVSLADLSAATSCPLHTGTI